MFGGKGKRVTVGDRTVFVTSDKVTPRELMQQAGLPAENRQLKITSNGESKLVKASEKVKLKEGQHFEDMPLHTKG